MNEEEFIAKLKETAGRMQADGIDPTQIQGFIDQKKNEWNAKYGGKTDAAAEETATVVADQPSGLGLQSESGLLELPEDDKKKPVLLEELTFFGENKTVNANEMGLMDTFKPVKDPKTGQYGVYIPDFNLDFLKINDTEYNDDPEVTNTAESLARTWNNSLDQLSLTDDRFSNLSEELFGDVESAAFQESKQRIDITEAKQKETLRLEDIPTAFSEGGLIDGIGHTTAAVTNAIASFGTSALQAKATGGVGMAVDMVQGSVSDYTKSRAEELGISYEDASRGMKSSELIIPVSLGALAYRFEKAGIKGVGKAINSMSESGKKALIQYVNASGKEGLTELSQGVVEAFNSGFGAKNSFDDGINSVAKFIKEEALETTLQGAVGGAGSTGVGRRFNKLRGKNRSLQNEKSLKNSFQTVFDIDTKLNDPSTTEESKAALRKQKIAEKRKIKNILTNENKLVNNLTEAQQKALLEKDYILNGRKLRNKNEIVELVANGSEEDFMKASISVFGDDGLQEVVKQRREEIIKSNKNLTRKKVEPQIVTDQKKRLDLAIKKAENNIANSKKENDNTAVKAFETELQDLKDKKAGLNGWVQYHLDELNEQESMDLMNMDDDVSLYQSIINDPMSTEAAREAAQKQLDLLKVQQVQTFMNPDAIDMRNPDGPKSQKNIDLSRKTQEAYEKGDIDGVIEAQQGLISSIATSLWSRVPKEKQVGTYDGFKSSLVTSKNGMLDMINSYSPEKFPGVPLAAYLGDRQKGLRVRANRIIKELTKQDFEVSTDSTEVLNSFSDSETNIDDIDIYGPKYNSQKLGLGTNLLEEASKDVELATQKIENELAKADEKAKPLTQKQRQSKAEKAFNSVFKNKYSKRVKDKIGKKLDKEKYIRDNVTTLKKIVLANRDFQKGNQGIAKDWNKYPPSDQAFIDYYMGTDTSNAQAISDRKKSLAEAVSDQIGKDAKDNYFEGKETERAEIGERLGIAYSEDLEVKKIRIFDFDDTLAKSNSQVLYTLPDGTTGQLNATEFAKQYEKLNSDGATFDFSEFSKVIDGKKGPLFEVAQKINAARGNEDLFVLTARPEDSAGAIQEFLKAAGLDFRKENIIGLGDGTAQAKADWVQGKIDEGYNDFYFADDAVKNVEAVKQVLDNADVKGKVQQAKVYQEVINDIEDGIQVLIDESLEGDVEASITDINKLAKDLGIENFNRRDPEFIKRVIKSLGEAADAGVLTVELLENLSMANFGAVNERREDGNKYYKLKDGTFIIGVDTGKINKKGQKIFEAPKADLMPKGAGLFYSVNDPAFVDIKNRITKANSKPGTKSLAPVVNTEAAKKGSKTYNNNQEKQKLNNKAFSEFLDAMDKIAQIDPALMLVMVHDAYRGSSAIIKAVAPVKYISKTLEFGTPGSKYSESYGNNATRNFRDEHNPPASVIGSYIAKAAMKGQAIQQKPLIDKQFHRVILSLKADEILDKAKLGGVMPESFRLIVSNSLGRYFNEVTSKINGGIDPDSIIDIETGRSIRGIYNIDSSGVAASLELTEQFKDKTPDKLQSAAQMQEDLNPNPELSNNEAVEALSDMLGTIYGMDVITTKKALEEAGYSEADINKALRSFGFEDSENGYVFINSEKAGLDTTMHEFTHVWANLVFAKDPELFNAIYDKLKSHPRYAEAISRMSKGGYANIPVDSFGYKNEVMAYILGEEGKSLYELFEGDAETKTLIDKFFDYVREALGFDPTVKNFADLNVDQVVKLAVKDMIEGNPSANFNKLQNVAEGKSWYAKSEAAQSPSAKAKADPLVRAFNKLKLSYRNNKDLGRAINDAYSEVENLMDFVDFVKLVSRNTKEIKTGKTNQLLIAKAEIIKADKIAEESAKKQAEDKVNEEQASKLQTMFRRIIYQAKGEGAKASRWFIPPNAEDFKGLLYAFLPKGQLGLDARKWMEENLLKPYSNGIATLDTEILHKSKAWTDMSKGFNFEKKVGGTPYTLGDAIKVYNALKEGVDPGIAKKKHLDALIHAVESNSEVLDLANEVAESFPIKLESGWQTRAFAKEIYDSINNGARKRHLETFSNNVDAVFTDATLDLIADQYGEKYRQAIVSTLRRMKSGRNRVSTDANANSYMNWLNRAVGTTMFLNTRSAVLQLLSTLNFLGKPGNNIFQATAAFANQKQWKADYNKLWNSDYLSNRRDGAKFDVLADEIAEGPQGLNKILKFGFLPTRYADSFAIALGGAAYYRNRVNMLMKEGMSEADAEAQAMIDWRATAEESQQSSDPSKISEIQASSIGKIIYAFANTPFQYARITKRKLQDISSGRSAAAGTLRTDMQSILYYSVGQAIMFNALQSGLVALLNSDDEEDEELKDEKYALMLERTLTSFAKSTGNPGAVASTLYAMMKEGYMQQTGKKRPDANAFAITATSISPPLNSKMRDLAGAYRAFNKIEEGDTFTPTLDNEALTMAGEVASFGGVPLDRVIRKARHLAAIKNEEAELWQKIWMLAGWSSWELGVKESKDTEFKAMDFKDVDFKEVEFKESAFKKLENGIAGRANNDGTIEVDPNLSPVERAKTIAHEKQHMKDMKAGKLNYDDNYVYWNGKKYERKNGKIKYKGKWYIEGHPSLPWEKKAYDAEPSTKEIKRKKLYA